MMRLHALKSMNKLTPTLKINIPRLSRNRPLHITTRPESMVHRAPRMLGMGTIIGSTIFTDHQARGGSRKSQIHQTVFVYVGLDVVSGALIVQGQGEAVSAEGVHAMVEHVVVQSVGLPVMRAIVVLGVEDFGVQLAGNVDTTRGAGEEIDKQVRERKLCSEVFFFFISFLFV